MTNLELEPRIIELPTDELKIIEKMEPTRYTIVESNKRAEKFHILKTNRKGAFFKVLYESGKQVPGLEGSFTSHYLALDALIRYLATKTVTKHKIYKDRWGDKEIPVLQTKKLIRKKKIDEHATS